MIHHSKGVDLEITDFEDYHDPTPSSEIIPSQRLNLKHVEILKFKQLLSSKHHWKGLDLEITDFENHHDPTSSGEIIPCQTLNLKHVEIRKIKQLLSLIHHWKVLTWRSQILKITMIRHPQSGEITPSQTSKP